MDQFKNWLTSKTVWSAAIGTLISVLHGVGVHVAFFDNLDADVFAGHMADVASGALYLAAGLFRVTATKQLTL